MESVACAPEREFADRSRCIFQFLLTTRLLFSFPSFSLPKSRSGYPDVHRHFLSPTFPLSAPRPPCASSPSSRSQPRLLRSLLALQSVPPAPPQVLAVLRSQEASEIVRFSNLDLCSHITDFRVFRCTGLPHWRWKRSSVGRGLQMVKRSLMSTNAMAGARRTRTATVSLREQPLISSDNLHAHYKDACSPAGICGGDSRLLILFHLTRLTSPFQVMAQSATPPTPTCPLCPRPSCLQRFLYSSSSGIYTGPLFPATRQTRHARTRATTPGATRLAPASSRPARRALLWEPAVPTFPVASVLVHRTSGVETTARRTCWPITGFRLG